uniref:Ferredoxin n=1 Tax=Angiostrongylus cantonensis TaxID=6313 RepID=A0A0K0DBJ3_ANGCA
MRLWAYAGRLASRISTNGGCDATGTAPVSCHRPSTAARQIIKRSTTTGAFHSMEKAVIKCPGTALEIVARLTLEEQSLLRDALDELAARNDDASLSRDFV